MTIEEGGVRRTTERNEVEGATEGLRHTVLDERRLTDTRRTVNAQHIAGGLGVGDPAAHELHDLELRLIVSVYRSLHMVTDRGHEGLTGFRAVLDLDGQILEYTEGQLCVPMEPLAGLVVLGGRWIDVHECGILGESHALYFGCDLLVKNLELERNRGLGGLHLSLELRQQAFLGFGCQTLEIADVAIDVFLIGVDLCLHKLHEAANILWLLAELVLLGLGRMVLATAAEVGDQELDGIRTTMGTLVIIVIILIIVIVIIIIVGTIICWFSEY